MGRRALGLLLLREALWAWAALLLLLPALPGPASSSSSSAAAALAGASEAAAAKECEKPCANGGRCQPSTGQCECQPGWVGEQCQHCGGRFRFNVSPRNCSGRGGCRFINSGKVIERECAEHRKGGAYDIPFFPEDCGFPERGQCR